MGYEWLVCCRMRKLRCSCCGLRNMNTAQYVSDVPVLPNEKTVQQLLQLLISHWITPLAYAIQTQHIIAQRLTAQHSKAFA